MFPEISGAGSVGSDVAEAAHASWLGAASRAGIDVTGFSSNASLAERIAWALSIGLSIATVYARFSTKMQNSTDDQVRACVVYAAQHGMYVPPELICADEGVKGRRVRRDGLERMRSILRSRDATILLVFKVSRLFRQAMAGYMLFQTEIVEESLRAISVSQGIDTNNTHQWKMLTILHGLADDMLIDAVGDHVREGLKGIFLNGYTVGALGIGYKGVEVPGAPLTKRGLSRTKPVVDKDVAMLLIQHFEWIKLGMPIREGVRRWIEANGPYDPRSTTKRMTYPAYRRMLSNVRYTGRWEYGRKKNRWSSKRDYAQQIPQPDNAVESRVCEELRIVPDELFWAVQKRLRDERRGRHKVCRRVKPVELHDLVTDVFHCAACGHRLYQYGLNGLSMECPDRVCKNRGIVQRKLAVHAVCGALTGLIAADTQLVARISEAVQTKLLGGDDEVQARIQECEKRVARLTSKIDGLTEMAGEGSQEDRVELAGKVRAAQTERLAHQREKAQLTTQLASSKRTITAEDVSACLAGFSKLLDDGGAGRLGDDVKYKAAEVFRSLVGGRIEVQFVVRPGRKRTVVRGAFTPALLKTFRATQGLSEQGEVPEPPGRVELWFRRPPRLDLMADEVRRLYEVEGIPLYEIGERLKCGSGNASAAWRRWYEIRGLPIPPALHPGGRPRKSA